MLVTGHVVSTFFVWALSSILVMVFLPIVMIIRAGSPYLSACKIRNTMYMYSEMGGQTD